jgi:hypothetical protein
MKENSNNSEYLAAVETIRHVDDRDPEALAIFRSVNHSYRKATMSTIGVTPITSSFPPRVRAGALDRRGKSPSSLSYCSSIIMF